MTANKKKTLSIHSDEFKAYGKVISTKNIDSLLKYLKDEVTLPHDRIEYVRSDECLSHCAAVSDIQRQIYGDMPVQAGYVCGVNTTQDGFEYHQGSEVIIAASDFFLFLGKREFMQDDAFNGELARPFFVPAKSAIELYSTTLHYCPISINTQPFSAAIILLDGTNEYIPDENKPAMLSKRNTWFIAHESFTEHPCPFLKGPHLCVNDIIHV
ncbi:DUF4867 domain-containing protein [Salmonella enterica subsp. enterica serovar Westminster]|nr:DUF4867 family protein [Salmonella enterica]EBU7940585.1 DUF4867 domain-containing protein [Salmonella enterica subsp. enterica serovar Chittagong]ECI2733312.1 DUF4867 family protein [Salmonella enterica subsp. enterica]EDH3993248.1 DUF4867 family protein [Salmonella enterica subsp. enterica serovar Westminster]EDH6305403.1 DUF4867 domain-containing protein [Salmonella enterica subsp. enterica serovar Westminster]